MGTIGRPSHELTRPLTRHLDEIVLHWGLPSSQSVLMHNVSQDSSLYVVILSVPL